MTWLIVPILMIIVFCVGLEVGAHMTRGSAHHVMAVTIAVLASHGIIAVDKELLENRLVWESIKREIQEKIADEKNRNA